MTGASRAPAGPNENGRKAKTPKSKARAPAGKNHAAIMIRTIVRGRSLHGSPPRHRAWIFKPHPPRP